MGGGAAPPLGSCPCTAALGTHPYRPPATFNPFCPAPCQLYNEDFFDLQNKNQKLQVQTRDCGATSAAGCASWLAMLSLRFILHALCGTKNTI